MPSQDTKSGSERTSIKDNFFSRFAIERKLLQEQMERLKDISLSEAERLSVVENCLSGISYLTTEVKDASSYLPAYDQRTYSTAVKVLTETLQSARSASAPKRRFAFRKSAPESEPARDFLAASAAQTSTSPPPGRDAGSELAGSRPEASPISNARQQITLTISALSSTRYLLHQDALRPAASITEVNHSFVDLSVSVALARPFSTLAINNVTESLLVCGQTSGAAHITGAKNSTLIIGSRQVRIHECKDCVVYLRCSSRPIIEDCHGIKFAPLPASFDVPLEEAPVSQPANLWDQVDDFKWLRAEHSPNWSVLQPDDKRAINEEGWGQIAADGDFLLDLDSLLKSAKVLI